ncbi:DUF4892 domain-containing protein [Methylovorus menthalis]|uniref:OmpA family protein n=1 Tax=Methylovorus menthalis TaxID=1002227 RepID=UPI001E4F3700|nr:OmpA family protein [Methylovorus menthalis]MCB4812425.1 DUF4892 domain-containing protein [Methylovorus menthalis]
MLKLKLNLILANCALIALALVGLPVVAADIAGAKDHPLLTRFAGTTIQNYQASDFDEVIMPVKPIPTETAIASSDLLSVEGKVTRIGYELAADKTALEVMRNYEAALGKNAFKPMFQCAGAACGRDMGGYLANSGKVMPTGFDAIFGNNDRYLLTRRNNAQGDVYVLLWVMEDRSNKRVLIYQQIAEVKPMKTNQVSVLSASDLKKSLDSNGKVAVYGIYFDTAKAEVKPNSKPALDEMAKLLVSNPGIRAYIVGHTDNVGSFNNNLELSQRRADAVVKALIGYKIDAQRLTGKGVASLAPVSSNGNDTGRGLNRRVELVLQ